MSKINWREIADEKEKYAAYLCSREWAELKRAVMERCGGVCERCDYGIASQTHHLTYIRKYNESLDDLAGWCRGCHEFTHGLSDRDPVAFRPVLYLGTKVKTVYLAGGCDPKNIGTYYDDGDDMEGVPVEQANWRLKITDAFYCGHRQDIPDGVISGGILLSDGRRIDYSGPYMQYDHDSYTDTHGQSLCRSRKEILKASMNGIFASDLVFAWIDREDVYGTIAEIGIAKAEHIPIVISGPKWFPELWFVYMMASEFVEAADPRIAFERALKINFTQPKIVDAAH
jgi:hypothetical protein